MTALEELVDPRPGAAALSMTITDKPFRANSCATEEPITPAPITTASHLLVIATTPESLLHIVSGNLDRRDYIPTTQVSSVLKNM